METLEWPEGVSKPEFMTREYGKTTGERSSRVRDAHSFELWTSLFADDCVLLFQSRDDLIRGSNHIFAHLRKFGLCMHVGRGDTASKTEAMYFPPPRTAYEAADTSRFYVDGTGFIDFCEKFKYLGSILHYSLTSDADVDKRKASVTASFLSPPPEGGVDLVTNRQGAILLHKAIAITYSQATHQPSGIRRFWFGVSLLSPLWPSLV